MEKKIAKQEHEVDSPVESLVLKVRRLLGAETYRAAVVAFGIASILKSVPFELESGDSLRVRMFPDHSWRMVTWRLVNYVVYANCLFLCVSFGTTAYSKGFGQDVAIHIFYVFGSMFGTVYFLSLYMKPQECVKMLNEYESVVEILKERGLGHKMWTWHPFANLGVYYMSYMFIGMWVILAGLFLWNPTGSTFLYGYLPAWLQAKWYTLAACFVYEMFLAVSWELEILVFFCFWCADIFTFNLNLVELGAKPKTTSNCLKAYLDMQVFSTLFNDFNGGFFAVGFVFMVTFTPTLCTFVSLKAFGTINIFIYLLFPVLDIFCFMIVMYFCPQHARVRIHSEQVLESLKSKVPFGRRRQTTEFGSRSTLEGTVMRKRIKAFPPLKIQISFFGCFGLGTCQGMMEQLFNNVLLLLSL